MILGTLGKDWVSVRTLPTHRELGGVLVVGRHTEDDLYRMAQDLLHVDGEGDGQAFTEPGVALMDRQGLAVPMIRELPPALTLPLADDATASMVEPTRPAEAVHTVNRQHQNGYQLPFDPDAVRKTLRPEDQQ